MSRLRFAAPALVALTLLSGCDEEESPTGVARPGDARLEKSPAAVTQGPVGEFDAVPRFDIDVAVTGSLRPDHPIHLTVSGRAHFATEDAEIRLVLPEVAAAKKSSWDIVELPAPGDSLPPEFRRRGSLAAGEQFRERVTVTIPEPGYYAVIASVFQHSQDPEPDGQITTDVAHKLIWLWIDEQEGRVTSNFDTSLFPAGTRQDPGPLGSEKQPPRLRRGSRITIQTNPIPLTRDIGFLYLNRDKGAYDPIVEAQVNYTVLNGNGSVYSSGSAYTDAGGWIRGIYCSGSQRVRTVIYSKSSGLRCSTPSLSVMRQSWDSRRPNVSHFGRFSTRTTINMLPICSRIYG